MGLPLQRADSIREYLSGAAADGDYQDLPESSIGGFRSSFEAFSLGIRITAAIRGVVIQAASGANPSGQGFLTALDANTLQWTPPGAAAPGPSAYFGYSRVLVLEGPNPSQFLRVQGTPPFTLGTSGVSLNPLLANVFGLDLVPSAAASSGVSQYRATVIRNESQASVSNLYRWIAEAGSSSVSDISQLGVSGAGIIQSSVGFAAWPATGWCQIKNGSVIREVVYYSSRSMYSLTVPMTGRGRLGTVAAAGAGTDTLHAVPGIAIALDPNGVRPFGSTLQTIADQFTAPAPVTWNLGITKLSGLSVLDLPVGHQIGVWIWREMPASVKFCPNLYNQMYTDFLAY